MQELSQEYLLSIIDYNQSTGICFWKPRPRTDFRYAREHTIWNKKHAATQITSTNPSNGKVIIHLFGAAFNLDQQLWKMMTGEEIRTVYHKNCSNVDNAWENLTLTPTKGTKYEGGELKLSIDPLGIYIIRSRDHIFNMFIDKREAKTCLLELCETLQCGWEIEEGIT